MKYLGLALSLMAVTGVLITNGDVSEAVPYERTVNSIESVQVESRLALVGVQGARVIDDVVLFDGEAVIQAVGDMRVAGSFDTVSIVVDNAEREPVGVRKVSESQFLILGTGELFAVVTTATKDPFSIDQRRVSFIVDGGSEPLPPPEPNKPDPDVPDDEFGNLAREVASRASGLPHRSEVAANYRKFAEVLINDPQPGVVSKEMVAARGVILGDDFAEWDQLLRYLNGELIKVPSITPSKLADFWRTIALGLEKAE